MYQDTLRGLFATRRLVPVAIVCVTLVVSQAQLAAEPSAGPLAAAMCLVFLLTAPYLWRRLNPMGKGWWLATLSLTLYGLMGLGVAFLATVPLPRLLELGPTLLTSDNTSYISLALFWVGGWGLGRDIEHEATLKRERERADALEREARRAQLLAIKSHLDPHFLFNTLNAIAEWCRQDGEVAEDAILKLSDMLRVVLTGVPLAAWSLKKEWGLALQLLELHLVRDPRMFDVEQSLEVDASQHQVPPLILLPLVENAVKHGPAAGHRGSLRLSARERAGLLELRIENPGPFTGLRAGGAGYSTVEQRLALAYDGAASVEITGGPESTRVTMKIPEAALPLCKA